MDRVSSAVRKMTCEECGTDLKLLFTSWYCPNEDKHGVEVKLARLNNHHWMWESRDIRLELFKMGDGFLGFCLPKYSLQVIFLDDFSRWFLDENSKDEINHKLSQVRARDFGDIEAGKIPAKVTWEEAE